jgi:serine/threonine-protein kinase
MSPAENAAPLKRIGRYDIVDVLGRGGMGVVYRGIDRQLGREVAIKTLTDGINTDPDMLARFYDEGRKTGRFNHPNIVTVHELGDDNGIPYIAMQLVEGDPLDKVIAAENKLPLVECLRIVEELCSALAYAHRNNVIHRDVKPANILVQPDGHVKLLDFGIARLEERRNQDLSLTRPGYIIGTVPYMAPERLRDKPLDGRSDIFAAGVVLYQLASGQLPFCGEELVLMQKILNEPVAPLSTRCNNCPPALDAIIERALAKSPENRYQTADEMASDLASVSADIRQEQAQQLLPQAKRLMEAQDLAGARAVLQQIIKAQTKHNTEARELLAEVQRSLTERQRHERVLQILLQAEALLNSGEFDKSLSILDDGLDKFPAHAELTRLRQRAEAEKEKRKQINDLLRQGEIARLESDFPSSLDYFKKALEVDEGNTKAIALLNACQREARQAETESEVKGLLFSARKDIASRRFSEALETLRKIESLDPHNLELQLLLGDANAGLEKVKRKETVARLESQASTAETFEELKQAASTVREAILVMPTESKLVVLLAKIDKQVQEQENRRFVDDTVQACRDLRPNQAFALVQKARQRLPGDERLMRLEGLLNERVRQQTVEERRDEYLSRAREALTNGFYGDAIQTLEDSQRDGLSNQETDSLLEFIRREVEENRHQAALRSHVDHAQALLAAADYDEALRYLGQALEEQDEPPLHMLLNQARNAREALNRQVETCLASAAKLVRATKLAEAIQYLEAQPATIQKSARVQTAICALEEEQQQAVFRMIGRAYSTLDEQLPAAESTIQWVVSAFGDSAFARPVSDAFHVRMQAFADRSIADLITKCKGMIRGRDRASASELIKQGSSIAEFAGARSRSDWNSFVERSNKAGLLNRLRNSALPRS